MKYKYAIGTKSPCNDSPAFLATLLDAANLAAAPASREEASKIRICSCARHHHIPYERSAREPRNQRQPIWAFSVWTTKTRWFLGHRDAGWGKGSCYDIIEVVVSYSSGARLQTRLWRPNESTSDPQRHWWGMQSFRASRVSIATLTASSSSYISHIIIIFFFRVQNCIIIIIILLLLLLLINRLFYQKHR